VPVDDRRFSRIADVAAPPPATGGDLVALMRARRSIRRLSGGPVSEESLSRLRAAVELSPAAFDIPAWRVVLLRDRRHAFWSAIDRAITERIEGERGVRYHQRIDALRDAVAVALFYEDLGAARRLEVAWNVAPGDAASYIDQGLGMAQLALWLAAVGEGLATSIHHYEWLMEEPAAAILGIDREQFRLRSLMPIGYAAEVPAPPAMRTEPTWVVDAFAAGTDYDI